MKIFFQSVKVVGAHMAANLFIDNGPRSSVEPGAPAIGQVHTNAPIRDTYNSLDLEHPYHSPSQSYPIDI